MKVIIDKVHLKTAFFFLLSVMFGLQCEAQNRIKKIDYDYDLVSGNVKQITYQANRPEMLVQQYKYDADNRITEVRSSTDGVIFDRDAAYTYYKHGPLARTVLGDNKVQGLDYTYTLQGWLKGVNSNVLDPTNDPGKDGQTGSKTARDVFGFSLGYCTNDYSAIGGNNQFLATIAGSNLDAPNSSLYNGNIRHMITSLTDNAGVQLPVQGNVYRYDQLNRIKKAEMVELNKATNSFVGTTVSTKYKENFNYDANGNIISLTRNGNLSVSSALMDNLTYMYALEGGKKSNNRLLHVDDNVASGTYGNDIDDDQVAFVANDPTTWNYQYDAVGNLISDKQEEIAAIIWTVTGKIKNIYRTPESAKPDLEFKYDALGHRICKIEKPSGSLSNPANWKYTYYVLDATGKTLAVYDKRTVDGEEVVMLEEEYLYGSKRLGSIQRDLDVSGPYYPPQNATPTFQRVLGKKQYELSNHLGNVLATVLDKRSAHLNGSIPDYYLAQVNSATDYYAFGSPMPARDFISDNYRYGFNGKENDREVTSAGHGTQDYGMRIYNPSLGRFLSIDPITKKFPELTPYQFASNRPIEGIDLDGLEFVSPSELGKRVFSEETFKSLGEKMLEIAQETAVTVLTYTDVNDATVIGTMITRGDEAITIEGTKADKLDKGSAIASALIPFVGGKTFKKFLNAGLRKLGVDVVKAVVDFKGFGGNILVRSNKTTTVLGRFVEGIDQLKKDGAFEVEGLNFLNSDSKLTGQEFFEHVNVPFLDEAIRRGDEIRLVSDPTLAKNLYVNGKDVTDGLTTFGKELDYLKANDYEIVGSSAVKKK